MEVGDSIFFCVSIKFSASNPGSPDKEDRKFFGKMLSFIISLKDTISEIALFMR